MFKAPSSWVSTHCGHELARHYERGSLTCPMCDIAITRETWFGLSGFGLGIAIAAAAILLALRF